MYLKRTLSVWLLFLAFCFFNPSLSFGQAVVDNPCGLPAGAEWPLDANCYAWSTAGMTPLYNSGTCNSGARDDAYAWITGDGNQITVDLTTGLRDVILHVYEVTALPCTVLEIGCADAFGNGGTETVIFNSTLGTNYMIRIQRFNHDGNASGTLCVTSTIIGGGSGDDCAGPIAVNCGDPALVAESSNANGNMENNWPCHGVLTPGMDRFYAVTVTGASNTEIRAFVSNVVDGNSTFLELIYLGSTCGINACATSFQYDIATQLFADGNPFGQVTIAGPGTYYFVVDDQIDGLDSYDIQFTCYDAGIELDVTNSCTPIPVTAAANQGVYATWNGAAPPATIDASTMSGTYTVCENIYIANPNGWQWLMNFHITIGECWTNVNTLSNFTPNSPPPNNAFYPSPSGTWSAAFIAGGANPDTVRWGDFVHGSNPTWGDGDAGFYSCYLYSFCFDANADPTCTVPTGFENGLQAQDDGVGGSGGSSQAATVTVAADDPVINILPIELISFDANLVEGLDGGYAVRLDWATATEEDNRYFTIERSQNLEHWEEVVRIDGAGNSSSTSRYMAFDEKPMPGVTYYRLTQTDFNGEFVRYSPVSVDFDAAPVQVSVYPVPATTQVVFEVVSPKGKYVTVDVTDVSGRLVQSVVVEPEFTVTKLTHDISSYKHGMYFVTVHSEGAKSVVEKMIVK